MGNFWYLSLYYLVTLFSASVMASKDQEKGVYHIPCGNDKDLPTGNKTSHRSSEFGCARLCMRTSGCASFTSEVPRGQGAGLCELSDDTSHSDCSKLAPRPGFIHWEQIPCQGRGTFDLTTKECTCTQGYTGKNCEIEYIFSGCYRSYEPKVFDKLTSFRGAIDWSNMKLTVDKCVDQVLSEGFWDFAIEFFGECWYNRTAALGTHGISNDCPGNLGKENTFAYYRITID